MPGIGDLERNIERLEQATADARAAVREAHEATKDLHRVRKETQREMEEVHEKGSAELRRQFEGLTPLIHQMYGRVGDQLAVLIDICMGDDAPSVANGKPSLRPILAAKLREIIEQEAPSLLDGS